MAYEPTLPAISSKPARRPRLNKTNVTSVYQLLDMANHCLECTEPPGALDNRGCQCSEMEMLHF
jgi:hypothetical protein